VKTLLPSSLAAEADGPNTTSPWRRNSSASPATSGGLWANNRQVNAAVSGESNQPRHVISSDVDVLGVKSGTGIARSTPNFFHLRRLGEFPDERVFATTRSNDENLHEYLSAPVQ
jgi:hypothetical protein